MSLASRESAAGTEGLDYFEIASGDTAHDESLLLKHFSASLSGVAFDLEKKKKI